MKDQTSASTRRRRNHEQAFKDDLIAMRGGVNANLLFKWRREHVKAMAQRVPVAATLLPVGILADVAPTPIAPATLPLGAGVNRHTRPGVIEVEIAGAQLRIRGAVDETTLGSVLRALRQSE